MRKKQESTTNGEQMSKEELTRTQVLNLSDFEQVTKYEKSTSKRPAIFLAILGLFCIMSGISYNPIMNIVIEKITPPKPTISKRIIDKSNISEVASETLTCHYAITDNNLGVELILDTNLVFYNNQLDSYTKTMDYVPILGKEKLGKTAVDTYYQVFKNFEAISIPGYTTKTTQIGNGFETQTTFDLKTLNPSLLTVEHKSYAVTNADFQYGDSKEATIQKAVAYGYNTCE